MNQQNYHCRITVNNTSKEAFQQITHVSEWWSENIEGSYTHLNDVFTVHFVFGDSFAIKIIDIVQDKKIVWLVSDCNLTWVKNSKEWKGTTIRFDITTHNKRTQIHFTHIGLVPEIECYNGCVKGWNQFIKKSLFKLLTEGKGLPDKNK